MQRNTRSISVDVCDYTNKALCNLYNSAYDIPGQAHDIVVHTERNGYKEIQFEIPSVLPDGEQNYRMEFLVSDYRIKLQVMHSDGVEIDWFLISESKIKHNAKSKNYEIKANHISSLLNTKNLELEFSDEEGNNVGTIGEIAATILEGTGWHLGDVKHFYEETKYGYEEETEKIRTFTASSQTGAFKMMSDLCELFDAKPLYHGEGIYIEDGIEKIGRTVDIIPINPFSKDLEEGNIPKEVLEGENVLELYYDRNVKTISRTLNTDNIVTKLAAYGSYGDRNGLCSLQEATHVELSFNEPVGIGTYCFEWQDSKYFFTSTAETNSLKWSTLDFASRSYVYDGENLYRIFRESPLSYNILTTTETIVKNYVPYLLDFTYYDKVGLLNDDMLKIIANHQTNIPAKHIAATEASIALSSEKEELMKTASAGSGFAMLDIKKAEINNGYLTLTLNTENNDGIVYRSDYDESKRNYFSWFTASGLKTNGEAIAGKGGIVYIVHEGNPTKWEKCYIKALGNSVNDYYRDSLGNNYEMHNELHFDHKNADDAKNDETYFPAVGQSDIIYIADDTKKMYVWFNKDYQDLLAADYYFGINEFAMPSTITLWTNEDTWHSTDKVYLFSSDSIAGLFGPREDEVYSNRKSIEEEIKTVTEIHPVYFITDDDPVPSIDECLSGMGWYYRSYTNEFKFGDLYFCWGVHGDLGWSSVNVYRGDENPETMTPTSEYGYFYSIKKKMLYTAGETWEPVKGTVDENNLTAAFAAVIKGCLNQEILTKGYKEEYYYDQPEMVKQGNYAFKNEFDSYWLFTTRKDIYPENGGQLRYKMDTKVMWQDNDANNIIKPVECSFTTLEFPSENELYNVIFSKGDYKNETFTTGDTYNISNNIYVHENATYEFNLPENSIVVCLNANNIVTGEITSSPFVTPGHTTHMRIVSKTEVTSEHKLYVQDYQNVLFRKNKMYKILSHSSSGERLGLNYLMDKFIMTAHEAYEVKLPMLKEAQQAITDANLLLSNTLGDMYREGCWRKEDYVEGDELKLYADTLDNLKEISHPEATYDIEFLDLYGSQPLTEDEEQTQWPDIEITYAVHLVDMDIDTNKWAYIDSLDKCYDLPWKTSLEVNTKLSMIGQQSFTDVLSKIAEVANETKANQTIYKRASILTDSGQLAADRLRGAIETNKTLIISGTSNWYTDSKGNIVFESADGGSAMMLSGKGWAIADTKSIDGDWDFRYMATGKGLTADAIYTGYLSAERLEAGSITTDKLSSNVGQELEIGSNKALTLYATVDGVRPAGSLETLHPADTDSWIAIGAKSDDSPAYIDIQSGGKVNLYGTSEMNIGSQGSLNLTGSAVNISSDGELNITGGSKIDIQSGGVLLVDTDNFSIQYNEITDQYDVSICGNITTTGGNIAGFTIGKVDDVDYMYAGQTASISSTAPGVYLGTNGINIGGYFKISDDGAVASFGSSKLSIDAVSGQIDLLGGEINISADSNINIKAGEHLTFSSSGDVQIGDDGKPFTIGSNGTNAYIYNGLSSIDGTKNGIYLGTDGIYIRGTAQDTLHYIKATAAGDIDISGKITTIEGSIGGWTIGSDYIGNNSKRDTSTIGLANLSSGIVLWSGGARTGTDANAPKFSVTAAGKLTSTDADIKGSIKATSLYIGATNSSNGTQMTLDSNGFIVSSGTTVDATKIKTIAGIKVTNNGIVIGSSTSDAAAAIKSEAGIKVDSTTGVVISSSGSAGSTSATKIGTLAVSNGKIDISCTNVGSDTSGVYITPTQIKVGSTGSIDFSAAKSISFKTGSIPSSAIADGGNKYTIVTGIDITTEGVAVSGEKYIKLDVNNSNYVHLSKDGIEMKGSRVVITDVSTGVKSEMWARDDIIVMNPNETDSTKLWRKKVEDIESHMHVGQADAKHDWVLIRPYYDARVLCTPDILGYRRDMTLVRGQTENFGNESSGYKYELEITCYKPSSAYTSFDAVLWATDGVTTKKVIPDIGSTLGTYTVSPQVYAAGYQGYDFRMRYTETTVEGGIQIFKYTFTPKGNGAIYNLIAEGYTLYLNLRAISSETEVGQLTSVTLTATCNASVSRVPCTVYYYP